jgi:hypothetical protein
MLAGPSNADNDDKLQSEGSPVPSAAPTIISDEIMSVARSISGAAALDDPNSPQFRAVGWLSTFDQVDPEGFGLPFVQRYVLTTLFFSTNGENWLDKEDWLNPKLSECDWTSGIFCEKDVTNHFIVTKIDLTRNGLSGSLPEELGRLEELISLRFPKNSVAGTIPSSIYELRSLEVLDMGFNLLNGQLPQNVGNAIELSGLVLNDNDLSGVLPPSLWSLSLLRVLDMSSNQLSGTITDNVNNLVKLVTLDLRNNLFSGEFPRDVEKMEKLDFLLLE